MLINYNFVNHLGECMCKLSKVNLLKIQKTLFQIIIGKPLVYIKEAFVSGTWNYSKLRMSSTMKSLWEKFWNLYIRFTFLFKSFVGYGKESSDGCHCLPAHPHPPRGSPFLRAAGPFLCLGLLSPTMVPKYWWLWHLLYSLLPSL